MPNLIQIKRGAASGLPALSVGELAFTTDTFRLYCGSSGGNKLIGEADFLKLSGGALTNFLTLHADPTSDLHAATKQYVDALITGIKAKASVRVATTANITLSNTQTVDGIALSAGDRVLVKDQTTTSQNGVYIVAAGAWTRATDADSWAEMISMFVWVEVGTAHADSGWLCTIDAGGTLGTTAVTYVQFSGAGQITAGNGLEKSGNTISAKASTGIAVAAGGISVSYGSSAGTAVQGNDARVTADQAAGTASIRTIGTGALQACAGNDARLSDARTPVAHAHGNIANGGTVGSTANLPLITGTSGIIQASSFGTAANTFCQGNDARLSDARTPLSHVHGNITNGGLIGTTASLPIITGTGGILQAGAFGASAGQFCQGNDARLHTQNTDTGTTSSTFQLSTGSGGINIKNAGGTTMEVRNSADSAYCDVKGANVVAAPGGGLFAPNAGNTRVASLKYSGTVNSPNFVLPDDTGTALLSDASAINGGTW
jgi:hypothetical protein